VNLNHVKQSKGKKLYTIEMNWLKPKLGESCRVSILASTTAHILAAVNDGPYIPDFRTTMYKQLKSLINKAHKRKRNNFLQERNYTVLCCRRHLSCKGSHYYLDT
jgi:hypothetical protein